MQQVQHTDDPEQLVHIMTCITLYNYSLVPRLPDRSSHFSVCNTEKLGIEPGNKASTTVQGYQIIMHYTYMPCSVLPHPKPRVRCIGRAWFRRILKSYQSFLSCLIPEAKKSQYMGHYHLNLLGKRQDYCMYDFLLTHTSSFLYPLTS